MGTTAYAFGTSGNAQLAAVGMGAGIRTPFGVVLPPSCKVVYVRSLGAQDQDPYDETGRLVPTLAQALAQCRSGLADTVVCLPGHVENVVDATMLANLVAGTKIIGVGQGSNTPTFTFTATAGQWVLNKNDVMVCGLQFNLAGINAVAKAFAVTGNDVTFCGCDFAVTTASNAPTVAIEVGTGAVGGARFGFYGNRMRGVAAGVAGDGILISGTGANIEITDNNMAFPATSASGLVRVATAALDLLIARNLMSNIAAASIAAISFGASASSGMVADNAIRVQSTGAQTLGTTGITTGATTICGFYRNAITNDPRTTGLLANPAVDA